MLKLMKSLVPNVFYASLVSSTNLILIKLALILNESNVLLNISAKTN